MADQEQPKWDGIEKRSAPPSAWQDPRFYLSAAGLLLTIVLALLGYIATQMSTLATQLSVVNATLASLSRDSGKQDVRIDKLEDFKREQEHKNDKVADRFDLIDKRETDYHFNLSGRVSALEGAKKGP